MQKTPLVRAAVAALAIALSLVLGAGSARAQEPPTDPLDRPGLDLAVRTGYSFPMGKIDGDAGDSLSNSFTGGIPIIVEAGYRINASFTVGALFQYAFLQVKDNSTTNCGNGVDCSGSDIRLGIEGIYRIPVLSPIIPWLGLGTGYEWMNVDVSDAGVNGSASAHGFEFITLQAGGDVRLDPHFALGPFVSYSIGQYSNESATIGTTSTSMDISNTTLHEWLQVGVRGVFNL